MRTPVRTTTLSLRAVGEGGWNCDMVSCCCVISFRSSVCPGWIVAVLAAGNVGSAFQCSVVTHNSMLCSQAMLPRLRNADPETRQMGSTLERFGAVPCWWSCGRTCSVFDVRIFDGALSTLSDSS